MKITCKPTLTLSWNNFLNTKFCKCLTQLVLKCLSKMCQPRFLANEKWLRFHEHVQQDVILRMDGHEC